MDRKKMIKLLMMMCLILAAAALNSCGGGSATSNPSDSMVTINLGAITTSSVAGRPISSSPIIPADIVTLKFKITATDMTAIERTVTVDNKALISESFMVPNGKNRRFSVEALDASGNILYKGETYSDLEGTPVQLSITMASTAVVAVDVSGTWSAWRTQHGENERGPDCITLIQSGNTLTGLLGASGNQVSGSGTVNGDQIHLLFSTGLFDQACNTQTLAMSGTVSSDGIAINGTYHSNYNETTLSCDGAVGTWRAVKGSCGQTTDTTKPVFGGLTYAAAYSATEAVLSWNAASDNLTPTSTIVYLIFMSTTPGGQNFLSPTFSSHPGATSFIAAGLEPVTTYYFVVRAQDGAGNIDTNTIEKSVTTMKVVSAAAISPAQ